jgi:hypothetical protein
MRRRANCAPTREGRVDRCRGHGERARRPQDDASAIDRIVHHSVIEVAEWIYGSELLDEYQRLTIALAAEPQFGDVGDLATLCAVAIARVQILERAAAPSEA